MPGIDNDDGYADHPGFCSNTCRVQCFPNPSLPWAIEWNDETCIFVPEPIGATNDLVYDDVLICDCADGPDVRPDANGDCDCPDVVDPDPEVDYMGFVAANKYCESLGIGAALVKIDSAQKNEAVVNMINAGNIVQENGGYDYDLDDDVEDDETNNAYWIGLYDDHETQPDPIGYWKWIGDGSLVAGNLALWESGEPNDNDGDVNTPGEEDCGVLQGNDGDGSMPPQPGRWNDEACENEFRFVCEFPLEQAP
jgi:hypothetical protein